MRRTLKTLRQGFSLFLWLALNSQSSDCFLMLGLKKVCATIHSLFFFKFLLFHGQYFLYLHFMVNTSCIFSKKFVDLFILR